MSSPKPSVTSSSTNIGTAVGSIFGAFKLAGASVLRWVKRLRKTKRPVTSSYHTRFGSEDISAPNLGSYSAPRTPNETGAFENDLEISKAQVQERFGLTTPTYISHSTSTNKSTRPTAPGYLPTHPAYIPQKAFNSARTQSLHSEDCWQTACKEVHEMSAQPTPSTISSSPSQFNSATVSPSQTPLPLSASQSPFPISPLPTHPRQLPVPIRYIPVPVPLTQTTTERMNPGDQGISGPLLTSNLGHFPGSDGWNPESRNSVEQWPGSY